MVPYSYTCAEEYGTWSPIPIPVQRSMVHCPLFLYLYRGVWYMVPYSYTCTEEYGTQRSNANIAHVANSSSDLRPFDCICVRLRTFAVVRLRELVCDHIDTQAPSFF